MKVAWIVRSAHAFVQNVTDMKAGFASGIVGMHLTCDGTAHLACESVAIEDECAGFLGDGASKSGFWFGCFQQILTWLEIAAVVMRQIFEIPLRYAARGRAAPTR